MSNDEKYPHGFDPYDEPEHMSPFFGFDAQFAWVPEMPFIAVKTAFIGDEDEPGDEERGDRYSY